MAITIMDNQRMNVCVVCEGLPRTSPTGVNELTVHYPLLKSNTVETSDTHPSGILPFSNFFIAYIASDSVLNEIVQQIAKLESQAVIATKYNDLTQKQKFHQAQVWVLKKRDASIVWKKHQSQVEKLVNELEQQTAALRKIEAEVESLRQAHINASDEINK